MLAYADVPCPIKAFLFKTYLYDMDRAYGTEVVPCHIIGISSYPGLVPTFTAMIGAAGGLYHALPPQAFVFKKDAEPLEARQAVYHNCPDASVSAFEVEALKKIEKCDVLLRCESKFVPATYLFTIDWYQNNILQHALRLETGQFVLYPSHEVLFHTPGRMINNLPDWKKLRHTWKV